MIKAHFSGRMVSSGISDVAFASVYSEIGKRPFRGCELMEEIRLCATLVFYLADFRRLSMKTYLYRASNFITFLALVSQRKSISGTRQKPSFLVIFLIIIIKQCPQTGCAHRRTTNLLPWFTISLTLYQFFANLRRVTLPVNF